MKFGQSGIHAQKCAIISAYKPPLSASLRTSRREIRRKAEDAAEQPPEDGQTALPPEEQPCEKEQEPAVQQDIGKVEVSRSDDVHTFWESFRCIRGLRREVRRRGRSSAKERPRPHRKRPNGPAPAALRPRQSRKNAAEVCKTDVRRQDAGFPQVLRLLWKRRAFSADYIRWPLI